MTPYTQLNKHDPENGIYGDCYRTAIGCLLDLPPEEVPHFWGENDEEQKEQANKWLFTKNYKVFVIPYSDSLENIFISMKTLNPDIFYILSGHSSRNVNHAFIALNDKIIHDPSGRDEEPTGPCDDGFYWVEVLVPLQVCKTE